MHWRDQAAGQAGKTRIGIEFDGKTLALVAVRHRKRQKTISSLSVSEWAQAPTVPALIDCLQAFAGKGRFQTDLVITTPRAMVRHFRIPPVAKSKREAAACWQGKKLIPFPLEDDATLFGMHFESDGKKGWWVTLVAMPREEAATFLDAVNQLGWDLRSLSLGGTQPVPENSKESTADEEPARAVLLFSARRGSFSVFRGERLKFHYDLGTIPDPPLEELEKDAKGESWALRAWIELLGTLIADPFDFCLNASPADVPTRLDLVGFPEAIAPLVTEWEERFASGVRVVDPLAGMKCKFPREVTYWTDAHSGILAPAALAGSGYPVIDCTPSPIKTRRNLRRLNRLTSGIFVVSLTVAAVGLGLNWVHLRNDASSVAGAREDLAQYRESPAVAGMRSRTAQLATMRQRLNLLQHPPVRWMPWVRTVLGTLPENASLSVIEARLQPPATGTTASTVSIRLDGTLSPDGPAHALTYRHWLRELESLAGGTPPDLQERSISWKGRDRSMFSIEMRPPLSVVTGGRP
jgi:hypothetical protein